MVVAKVVLILSWVQNNSSQYICVSQEKLKYVHYVVRGSRIIEIQSSLWFKIPQFIDSLHLRPADTTHIFNINIHFEAENFSDSLDVFTEAF